MGAWLRMQLKMYGTVDTNPKSILQLLPPWQSYYGQLN